MFKICFIYPGHENLWIEYLSAGLIKEGFATKLFLDPILFSESGFINNRFLAGVFSFRKRILKAIIDYKPDLVCFSVTTDNYKWACGWAKKIKEHIAAPIIFGGIHPTAVPEKVIINQCLDYVCVGEGDQAIVDLAKALANKKSTDTIKNIWTKADGNIIRNEVRPLIYNLDRIPLADKNLFYSAAPIFNSGYTLSTSRGCPFSCSYCCNSLWKKIYADEKEVFRRRGVKNVIQELKIAKFKYKPKYVAFLDEVFNMDSAWLNDFLYQYKKEINLPFFCFVYPDLASEEVVQNLKHAGCYKVQMGVQIIDENQRKTVLKRNSSNKAIARAIDLFKKEKIYIVCDNIFGFPDDKEEDLDKLAYFYNSHLPDHIEIFWLRYYPKTEITGWAFRNNYIAQKKVEEIEEGCLSCGIVRGGDCITNYSKKFMLLFYLFRFLTPRGRLFIIRKRVYRLFPSFSATIILYILSRIYNRAKYDLNISRTAKRYTYFIVRKFMPKRLCKI